MIVAKRVGFTLLEMLAALVVLSLVAACGMELLSAASSAGSRAERGQLASELLGKAAERIRTSRSELMPSSAIAGSAMSLRVVVADQPDVTPAAPSSSSTPHLPAELVRLELVDESGEIVRARFVLRAADEAKRRPGEETRR